MKQPNEFRKLLKADKFVPLQTGLSDGRCVLLRHPDQVFVAERHLLVGLAKLERSKPLATPASGDRVVKDWMIINLLQITGIEPINGTNGKARNGRSREK